MEDIIAMKRENLNKMNKFEKTWYRLCFFHKTAAILKTLKVTDLPKVADFFSQYTADLDFLNIVDIFVVDGIVLKDGHPAYALFFDGDEDSGDVSIFKNGRLLKERVVVDSPIVLLSNLNDDLLLETSIVHELCHYIDGMPSGEEVARRNEYNFLHAVYGYSDEEAKSFLVKKYKKF